MTNFWKNLTPPITAMAPMDDVTDFVFRELVSDIAKPDVIFTEFTGADALCSKGHDKVKRKLLFSSKQRPIVAQIWGSNPENYTKVAKYIEDRGFDGIDINMGCPVRGIIKGRSGAFLIGKLDLVGEIIDAVRIGAPNLPLSIKTRLAPDPKSTKEWLTFLMSKNIEALTIHGRTAKAMSKGEADWDEIGKAVELRNVLNPSVAVIGNGDVISYKEVLEKHKKYGVDGVMIGRGIFHDPWIFDKTDTDTSHTQKEHLDLLIRHAKLYEETWGRTKNFNSLKKFFKIYIKDFRGAEDLRMELMRSGTYEDLYNILNHSKNLEVQEFLKVRSV